MLQLQCEYCRRSMPHIYVGVWKKTLRWKALPTDKREPRRRDYKWDNGFLVSHDWREIWRCSKCNTERIFGTPKHPKQRMMYQGGRWRLPKARKAI